MKLPEIVISVEDDGAMNFLNKPEVEDLVQPGSVKRRISHVEPVNSLFRFAFHLIRKRVSDESRLAQFTREWNCLWRVRVLDGPTFGRFASRQAAIDAEVEFWQREKM